MNYVLHLVTFSGFRSDKSGQGGFVSLDSLGTGRTVWGSTCKFQGMIPMFLPIQDLFPASKLWGGLGTLEVSYQGE